MKKSFLTRLTAAAVLSTLAFVGCTKEVPYKYEAKETVSDKLSEDEMYLYVPSTENSSRTSDVARPYWQGQEKLVKFRYVETGLQVIEIDREKKFSNNTTNNKLVLEIPGEHLQFRCAEDSFGECTNKEEKNEYVNWKQRPLFKPDYASMKVVETNTLPIELENLFTGGCYVPANSRLVGYEKLPDKLNIQIEKTFNADAGCLAELDNLSDITLSQVYHYSFVKLNKIATPGFTAVNYPKTDENTFGFFSTEYIPLDVDNNQTSKNKTVLMNHWDPNRKVIDYHLTANFNKPENAKIKAATIFSVEKVNQGFADAGVDLKIVLHDDKDLAPGDITNSMIVLVEDPSATSVLGYGPTATNPLTGEIVSGRVIMYKGILESYIKMSYEEIRRAAIEESAAKSEKGNRLALSPAVRAKFNQLPTLGNELDLAAKLPKSKSVINLKGQSTVATGQKPVRTNPVSATMGKSIKSSMKEQLKSTQISSKDYLFKAAKHCLYTTEAISLDSKVHDQIIAVLGKKLKKWEDLNSTEKEKVLDVLMPVAYISTLIHEIGHNLGLRHNFAGSEDVENYYTKEELAAKGVEHVVPYSSVMDYGASELDLLPSLGKYDIAALKFGYLRKVNVTEDGLAKEMTLKTTLEDFTKAEAAYAKADDNVVNRDAELRPKIVLKNYEYCTDENVGANANCKRFDSGKSYVEIAQSLIKSYEERYYLRNFRNHRLKFSMMGDVGYAKGIDYTFENLRIFFEVRERIVHQIGLDPDDRKWDSDPNLSEGDKEFLKDVNDAAILSARFFMNVLTTPDMTCVIGDANKPEEIAQIISLNNINTSAAHCFDFELNPQYVMLGSYGKGFASKRGLKPESDYVDQIETRGIWVDKLLAANYLFAREIGSFTFDSLTDNYTDIPQLREELVNLSASLVLNKVEAPVTVRDQNGTPLISGVVAVDTFKSHAIPTAITPRIAKALGVPAGKSLFAQTLLSRIAQNMQSTQDSKESGREIAEIFKVHRIKATSPVDAELGPTMTMIIDSDKIVATQANTLGSMLIVNARVAQQLATVSDEVLEKVISAREAGQSAPAQIPPGQEFIWSVDLDLLKNHLSMGLAPSDFTELISILPGY